ncbi:MAG: hypothetical protein GX621_13840, partial [Pirellulaceae bacterium]|nr:hypothetical protein [Pirellulaceae bacterium]
MAPRLFTSRLGAWVFAVVGLAVQGIAAEPASTLTLRADWFDRGNVAVAEGGHYADRFACIFNAGELPNQTEYELDLPVAADYTLVALYAAAESRPLEVYLDGKKVHHGFASVTGSWQTSTAQWEKQCTFHATAGRHVLKLLCPGPYMGHVCALRLESSVAF